MSTWFHEAKFGMFIHWGPYSVAGRGEWFANRELIPFEEYAGKYADAFTAENYDPEQWVLAAKRAGMRYMVLTTRHHDGFALWDTKTSPFNSVRRGPKRDLIRPYVEAVRKHGLKVGFYYSVADWYHPDYPGPYYRDWPDEWRDEDSGRRFEAYYKAQIEELMTQYGRIDLLWYDGCFPAPSNGEEVNRMVKRLQPGILINNRNGAPYDFYCSEQAIRPPEQEDMPWEACFTLNDNWAYHAGDRLFKTAKSVLLTMTEVVSKGGNFLLNVGPRADGTIPEENLPILEDIGQWMKRNGEAIYGSGHSRLSWNNASKLTRVGNRVYVHMFHGVGPEFCLAEIRNRVESVRRLDTGEPMPFRQEGARLFIGVPETLPDPIAFTFVIEADGEVEPIRKQTTFWIPGF